MDGHAQIAQFHFPKGKPVTDGLIVNNTQRNKDCVRVDCICARWCLMMALFCVFA